MRQNFILAKIQRVFLQESFIVFVLWSQRIYVNPGTVSLIIIYIHVLVELLANGGKLEFLKQRPESFMQNLITSNL